MYWTVVLTGTMLAVLANLLLWSEMIRNAQDKEQVLTSSSQNM